jgi:hypothetical protein
MTTKSNAKIESEKLHLFAVKVFKACLDTEEHFRDNPKKVTEYLINTASDTSFSISEKRCRFRLFFKFSAIDDERNPVGLEAEFGIEFHFIIDNIEDFLIHKVDDEVFIDSQLGVTLCGISYSTARGIIIEKMQGTYFDGVILPIVSPAKLLEDQRKVTKG